MFEGIRKQLLLLAEGLATNESRRVQCPDCGKKEMSVTRDREGVLFNCYRASCGISGFIPSADREPTVEVAKTPPNPYTGPLTEIDREDTEYFFKRFAINPNVSRRYIRVAPEEARYALVVKGPAGELRGHTLRAARWKGEPAPPRKDLTSPWSAKAITYKFDMKSPYVGHVPSMRPVLFIVEDMLSAMRVASEGCYGVSLNGTHVSSAAAQEIGKVVADRGIRKVVIMLDPDAHEKAQGIYALWGSTFGKHVICCTWHEHDPKDDPYPGLERLV